MKREAANHHRSLIGAAIEMLGDYRKYGVLPFEYVMFDFYKKEPEKKATFFTFKDRKRLVLSNRNRKYNVLLDDKYLFSRLFDDLYKRPAYRNDLMTPDELSALCANAPRVVYKPLVSNQGKGIRVFDTDSVTPEALYETLKGLPRGIVEGWIRQSAEMNRLYADAVNCIRVVTVAVKGEICITGATLTLGSHVSHVANADSGGVFALVDENTGEVLSDLVSYEDTSVLLETHPDTGMRMKGYRIEKWDEVRALALQAAARLQEEVYVSWDIAVRDDGPILIEGNSYGGYAGYQLPGVAPDGKGTREKYARFLK